MKIETWCIGKTAFEYIEEGIGIYQKRLTQYISFDFQVLPDVKDAKNMPEAQLKELEGAAVLKKLQESDILILLDEQGKSFSSVEFAEYIEKLGIQYSKRIIFLIGGAYGFSEKIYQRAHAKISLSKMTFSHQMVRVFFVEQLYRAFSILRNEPYHHR